MNTDNDTFRRDGSFIVLDSDQKIIFINDTALAMLSLDRVDVVDRYIDDKKFSKFTKGLKKLKDECKTAALSDMKTVSDHALSRRDNSMASVSYEISPLKKGGINIGCVVTFSDSDEMNGLRKKMIDSEIKLNAMIDNPISLIMVLDDNGDIIDFNQIAADFFKVDKDQVIGTNYFDILADTEKRDQYLRMFQKILTGEPLVGYADTMQTIDGFRTVEWNAHRFTNNKGIVVGVVVVGNDVTEKRGSKKS